MYLPIIIPVLHAVRHDGGVQFVGRQSRHSINTLTHMRAAKYNHYLTKWLMFSST